MAVNATAIWRVRPSGSNTNGGGYDPGIAGAATDYSQQNAAQATGTLGTASGTTTFTDAGGAFTSAMVGNALWIASGAGFTVGAYFVTAFGSSTSVTLDRSPGTGSAAHWALGGGWADFWTNTTAAKAVLVSGNIVYILGSGTPNPSSYSYDYNNTVAFTPPTVDEVNGNIIFANDPLTPGYKAPPDTTGGMPTIKVNAGAGQVWATINGVGIVGLWFIATVNTGSVATGGGGHPFAYFFGCVFDSFGFDTGFVNGINTMIGCEAFTSVGAASGTTPMLVNPGFVSGCNIHDCLGIGIQATGVCVTNTIIAKCGSTGIKVPNTGISTVISNNTIDGNGGNGIELVTQLSVEQAQIFNNIISNHTGGGKSGMVADAGTAVQNRSLVLFNDYNSFYNNTANYTAISAGPHDTSGGSNPYVGQSTENYTLA